MNNSEKYRTILADEKPMGCPFCGSSTEVVIDECGCYSISCIHCEYGSPAYNEDKYAIEAHNRICRAVAAYKEMSESQKKEGTLDEATSMKLLSMPVGVLVQWYAGKERQNKPFAFRVPCGDGRFVLVAVKLEDVK